MTYKIAITGATGFIGSHLATHLRKAGHSVYEVSKRELQSGQPTLAAKAEIMIHCAAAGAQPPRDDPKLIHQNVTLLSHAFGMCEQAKLFINFGSSSEYGPKTKPMAETDVLEPVDTYATSKAVCTLLSAQYGRQMQRNVITVRPFSVYGPGEADHRLIPTICRSLVTSNMMSLKGGEVHDWIYIHDFCRAIACIIDRRLNSKYMRDVGILNLGTGIQTSNLGIANILTAISGVNTPVTYSTLSLYKAQHMWQADMKITHSFIGDSWMQNSLFTGLQETFDYYKAKYAQQTA